MLRSVYEGAKLERRGQNQESYLISQGGSSTHEPTDGLKVDIKKLHNREIP